MSNSQTIRLHPYVQYITYTMKGHVSTNLEPIVHVTKMKGTGILYCPGSICINNLGPRPLE